MRHKCDIKNLLFLDNKGNLRIVAVVHVCAYFRLSCLFAGDFAFVNSGYLTVGRFICNFAGVVACKCGEVKLVTDFYVESEGDRRGVVGLESIVEIGKLINATVI